MTRRGAFAAFGFGIVRTAFDAGHDGAYHSFAVVAERMKFWFDVRVKRIGERTVRSWCVGVLFAAMVYDHGQQFYQFPVVDFGGHRIAQGLMPVVRNTAVTVSIVLMWLSIHAGRVSRM